MASGAASAPLGRKEPKGALPNVQPKLPFPGIHLPRARLVHCGHSYVVTKTKRSPPPLTRADQTSGLPPVQPARTDVAARFCVCATRGRRSSPRAVGEAEQELPLLERAGRAADASLPKRGNAHEAHRGQTPTCLASTRQLPVTLPIPQPDGSLPDGRSGIWAGPAKKELAG